MLSVYHVGMWEQTGSDSNLTHLHSYKQYMRHPISEEQANLMSNP